MASDLCEVFHFADISLVYTHFLISNYFSQWPFANIMVTNGHFKKSFSDQCVHLQQNFACLTMHAGVAVTLAYHWNFI